MQALSQEASPMICDQVHPQDSVKPPEVLETINNTSNVARSSGLVLLQTARAMASGKEGGASVNIRILFDTGSQRSYVTEILCSRLCLKPVKKERLHLRARLVIWFRYSYRRLAVLIV